MRHFPIGSKNMVKLTGHDLILPPADLEEEIRKLKEHVEELEQKISSYYTWSEDVDEKFATIHRKFPDLEID